MTPLHGVMVGSYDPLMVVSVRFDRSTRFLHRAGPWGTGNLWSRPGLDGMAD
jgi:hypothetical protein